MAVSCVKSAEFEQSRLELFRSHDFNGTAQWLTDQSGRRTGAVVGGPGERTTLLLHGVLSQAGEWALVAGRSSASAGRSEIMISGVTNFLPRPWSPCPGNAKRSHGPQTGDQFAFERPASLHIKRLVDGFV